ncbi:MAG: hypothetical protein ACTHNE_13900, partial [Dyella sp.]|uniref:hypothetical protein n=1 Tax=Dyella sp. TaxID=1869338 RepID=UPI003F7DE04A
MQSGKGLKICLQRLQWHCLTMVGIKAALNKYRRRHDAWKARRVCCAAPGRLAVLPSRAAQPAGLPGITHPFKFTSWASPVCPHAFDPPSRQTAGLPSPTA